MWMHRSDIIVVIQQRDPLRVFIVKLIWNGQPRRLDLMLLDHLTDYG
jgi:hypothetical protein